MKIEDLVGESRQHPPAVGVIASRLQVTGVPIQGDVLGSQPFERLEIRGDLSQASSPWFALPLDRRRRDFETNARTERRRSGTFGLCYAT